MADTTAATLQPAPAGTVVPAAFSQATTTTQSSLWARAKTDWLSGATFSVHIARVEQVEEGGSRARVHIELECSPTGRNRFTNASVECSFAPAEIAQFDPRTMEGAPPPGHRGAQQFSESATLEPEIGVKEVQVKIGSRTASATGESDGVYGLTGARLGPSGCRWTMAENAFSKKRGIGNFHSFWVELATADNFQVEMEVIAETSGARAGNLKVKDTWQFWRDPEKGGAYNFVQLSAAPKTKSK